MFTYNHELHEIETRNHDRLHLYSTRTSGARNVLRHHIPKLLNKSPPPPTHTHTHLVDRFKTHSLYPVSHHIKCYLIDLYSYDCDEIDCYICNNNSERKFGDLGDLGAVKTLWSLTVVQVVAITTSSASIDMGWSTWSCFHIAHAQKRQFLRFSLLTALEVVKMITSSTAGDGSFVAVTTISFRCIAAELLLRAFP